MNAIPENRAQIRLVGSPACRRYHKMRAAVLDAAARLGVQVNLEEVNDTERLSAFNPLSLPRLYIEDKLVASQNPPKTQDVERALAGTG